jgi:dephospho-CoA kinase
MDDPISATNMNKLVKAIQAGEKINPIIVVPYEGKLLIIDGHHRYFAHIKAGADKIPVVMADPKDLTWRDDVPVDEAKVEEGVNDPHIFKAVFLAGGPGSGKSFVARNILGGTGLKTMNSDDVYEILMKKQDLALDPDTIASPQGQEIRDKAKLMTKKRSANWIDGRLGLLIDGTGKDVAKYQKQAEFLRMLGYDVAMIFVNTSEEVAQQRNRQRARSLKPEMVSAMWNDVQQNLMKFQQIFGAGRFHIIDNSGGLEDLDRQKNFDKVYNETQRFLNTPPSKPAAKKWIQNQKAQNDATQRSERTTTNNTDSDGGVGTTN